MDQSVDIVIRDTHWLNMKRLAKLKRLLLVHEEPNYLETSLMLISVSFSHHRRRSSVVAEGEAVAEALIGDNSISRYHLRLDQLTDSFGSVKSICDVYLSGCLNCILEFLLLVSKELAIGIE
jgi:hypothetical protein